MTLKTRNVFFIVLFACFFAALITNFALLFYNMYSGSLIEPDTFPAAHISGFYATRYSFAAVILSLFLFLLYATLGSIYLYIQFEKTQSLEVIFFAVFLIGCTIEAVRLYVPFFNLWHSLSTLLIFTGRAVLFGRTVAPAALLFNAVFSGTEQRQNIERNLIVLLVISITMATLIPLNTAIVLPNFCIHWGASKTILTMRMLIMAAAVLSVFINMRTMGTKEKAPYGFLSLTVGYAICCIANSFAAVIIGNILLYAGTAIYLGSLHRKYLWQ